LLERRIARKASISPSEGEEGQNPSRGLSVCRSSGGTTFSHALAKLRVEEFARGKSTKVEAFENVKFFQVWEEGTQGAQEGEIVAVGSAGNRDLDRWFPRPEKRTEGGGCGSSDVHIEISSTVGSGEDAQG
jgi:hypothetical protein